MLTPEQMRAELADAVKELARQQRLAAQHQEGLGIAQINIQRCGAAIATYRHVLGETEGDVPIEQWKWFSTLAGVSRAARRRASKQTKQAA